jgi:HK97 family phage major capsid protein
MNLKEKLAALVKDATAVAEKARAEGRDLSADEQGDLDGKLAEISSVKDSIAAGEKSAATMAALDGMAAAGVKGGGERGGDRGGEAQAKSLGEHFVKHAHGRLIEVKGVNGASVGAPEFGSKAATDPHVVGGWTAGVPFLTDFDRTIVQAPRPRLTVADLLGAGTVSGNAISYLVEAARAGGFANVAEGGAKPQMNYGTPTSVVDAVKKIAGFIKLTDEFLEDADFLKSEIDGRLLYDLGWYEEQQLLSGNGTGQNLTGLLLRSGIQTETGATILDNPDAIFRAMTKVFQNSGLPADGIVIHPTDYQAFRLKKDANQQYYGGGFFAGQYGSGVMQDNPPLWGLRTVVTPAIAAGAPLVGAFASAATMYRKGGVRVESTNSHVDDFTNNLVTIRAEERVALAVRKPLGFCKVTLGTT